MASDPARASREFDCVITDVAGSFLEASTVDAAISATTPRARRHRVSAGMDLAFVHDMSALVIVERQIVGTTMRVVVVVVDLADPRHDAEAKKPSAVVARFVNAARDAGANAVVSDGHHVASVREHAMHPDVAMQVVAAPTTPAIIVTSCGTPTRFARASIPPTMSTVDATKRAITVAADSVTASSTRESPTARNSRPNSPRPSRPLI
jgi:hypothetical protein